MKKTILLLAVGLVALLSQHSLRAQTTLAPGDLFFTGFNSVPAPSNDNFSFVLLVNVTGGTQISFTDKGWFIDGPGVEGFQSNANSTQDGSITWTAPAGGVSCGTEIWIQCEWSNALSATVGTVTGGVVATGVPNDAGQPSNHIEFGGAGDQLFAFQGTIGAPTLIAGFDGNGGWVPTTSATVTNTASAQPTALGATHAPAFLAEADNYKYNCPTAPTSATKASLYTSLKTAGNWVSQANVYYTLPTGCTWSVTDCTPLCTDGISPTFTTCLGNQTVLVGAGCATTVPDYAASTVATDNVGVTFKGHVNCTFPSCPTVNRAMPGASLALGSTLTVSVVARDACNNEATCTFNVTGVSPEINLQGNGASIADGDVTPSLTDHTDFGSQSVCSGTIVRTFTIQNSPGTAPLNIGAGGITITGTDAAMFTLGGITLPANLATSGSTTFTVTFNPTSAGLKTATINIANDDCNEAAYDFAIQGTGTDPEVNVTGNSVPILDGDASPTTGDHTDFSTQNICSGTVVRTFTIENTGNSNLTVGTPTITGAGAADFTLSAAPAATVAPASFTTFQVTFDPSTTGFRTATITFTTNDCDEATYDFAIRGQGVDPEINLVGNTVSIVDGDVSPTLADHTEFGSQSVCSGTVVRTYTIENSGSSALILGPGSITISGTDASMFTFGGLLLGVSIGPGTSMTFTVTFNPSSTGLKTAQVNLVSNDCNEATYNFAIQGTGIDPEMDVLGNSLSIADNDLTPSLTDHTDFGNVNVSSNLVRTYTIANTGSVDLTIGAGAITLSGTDAAMFTVGGITLPATIGPSGSTTFTVTFAPTSGGLKSAAVNIANNDCDENPYNYNIQGTGIALPEANVTGNGNNIVDGDVTPTTTDHTDFGGVLACTGTIVRTFTIQNTGGASLTVGTPTITGAGAADFSLTAAPAASVAPAGSTTFQITFNPSVVGLRSATVSFTNNDADENPYDFAIQGTGLDDFVSPTITTCPGAQNVIVSSGCNAILPDYTSLVTATDNCGIIGYFQLAPNTPGTSFPLGSTITVSVVGRDAIGNEGTCTFNATAVGSEINLQGNGNSITDGDLTPSLTDHTDFSFQSVCSGTITRTFTIQNAPGTANLTIGAGAITVTGADASMFTVGGITLPATIPTSGSTTFTVSFNPSSPGVKTATINIASNDCNEAAYDFAIQGTGIDPEIDVLGNSLSIADGDLTPSLTDHTDFGSVLVSSPFARTYTISNTGNSDLTIGAGAITVTGADATMFVVGGITLPATVTPSGSTTFTVTFTPTSSGLKSATVNIASNDCDEATYNYSIQGNGLSGPEIDVRGNFLSISDGDVTPTTTDGSDFGTVPVCAGTQDRTFKIHNTGAVVLNISAMTITGAASADYSFTGPGLPYALAAGDSVPYTVTFNPSATGARNATFNITSDDLDEAAYDYALTGTGGADVVNPSITCPSNITTVAAPSLCTATVTYTAPVGTDNCPSPLTTQTAGLPSGSLFPVGVTTNTFQVTDGAGNTANCSFTVTVNDTQLPVLGNLSCGSSNASATAYSDGWQNGDNDGTGFGAWTLAASTGNTAQAGFVVGNSTTNGAGTDTNLDGDINSSGDKALGMYANSAQATQATRSITSDLPVGRRLTLEFDNGNVDAGQIVGFQLQNSAGNSLGEIRYRGGQATYEIVDIAGITPFTGVPVTDQGIIIEVVPLTLGTSSLKITRKVDGTTQTLTSAHFPGGGNQLISRIMVFNSNAGLGTAKTLYVNNLSACTGAAGCPANITVSAPAGACDAVVTYNTMVATDNCASSLPVTQTAGLASGATFPEGVTTNSFNATDGSGNAMNCSFTVTVNDVTAPTALCASPTVYLNASGAITLTAADINAGSTDACGIASMGISPSNFDCSDANVGRLVVSDLNSIDMHESTGAFVRNLYTTTTNAMAMAYVPSRDSIYYSDPTANAIKRVHVNGGAATTILSGINPFGIDVDIANGHIYYADFSADHIRRVSMGGTAGVTLVTGAANTDYSRMLKLDLTNSKIYFTDANLGTIKRCNLDGTGLTTLISGMGNIVGLGLDVPNNKMYYSSYSFSQIRRANLDGTGVATILSGLNVPLGLSLDLNAGKIYHAEGTGNKVSVCNLDGTGNTAIITSGLSQPYDLFLVPPVPTTLTVTDVNGNTSTCVGNVTVRDTIDPVANCQNITVQLNASGNATITGTLINNASTDACGIASLSASPSAFTCANVGANTVTLTVTDVNGNTKTCTSTVTVQDTVRPVANCQNITVQLNASGNATVTGAMVNNASTDACGIASLAASPSAFTCANVGSNTVTLTVTDVNGNTKTCNSTVLVQDTVRPVANCQNITVQLNASGNATVTGAMVNNASTDACGIASLAASPSAFTCANVGANTVTLTVTDVNGNTQTCASTVTVQDTVRPTAVCQNVMAQLSPSGSVTVTAAMVNGGSTDACGIASLSPASATYTCANVGANTFTLTVTDVNGNTQTCNSTVTVQDTVKPVATCQNITVQLNASGNATVTGAMINAGSADNCGIASLGAAPGAFTCANVGSNTVTLTVTDVSGNTQTCNSTVTVQDTVKPVATCQNITAQLNVSGNATVTGAMINAGSTDACGIASLAASPSAFTCANVGPNTVVLTVTDVNGNTQTCNSTVTVQDTVKPIATCQSITVQLNPSGNATVTGAMINAGSTDACGIASLVASPSAFTCANVGPNTVTLTVTDVNGNARTCTSTVTVQDTVRPVAVCQNITVQLNALGDATVTGAMINGGSTDACGIASLAASPSTFTCANVGPNTVTLTVTDVGGNTRTCTSTVTVQDTVKPLAVCQSITAQLNPSGNATVTGAMINGGSTDACGIASLAASPSAFTCANVGPNTVTLTVTDVNGNARTCTSTVTVQDTVRPVAICQNIAVQLNASGNVTVTGGMINGGSTDACGIASLGAAPGAFTCANVGPNTVTLTVTDVNGNTQTCTSVVTVQDTVRPVANCQNITVQLNASGNATVTGAMINNASTDACGIASLAASPSAFTCANVGANTVTLTVTDVSGNTQTCTSTVTVQDTVRPTAICQNVIAHLNPSGSVTVTAAMVNAGSTDACGIASLSPASQTYTCANVGANTFTLTVTDVNGNTQTCNSTVSVVDTVDPTAICQNITVHLNASGNATVTGAMINAGSTDACGIATLSASPSAFTCANVGANTVTLTVTDVNGNSSTCTSTVTLVDTVLPVASCQNITAYLNAAGTATVTGAMINAGSTDACGIASLSASPSAFTCANVGANTVTLTVTDVNGNSRTCTSTVTLLDTVLPVASCQNITSYLNAAGTSSVTGAMINAGSTDACGIATLSASPSTFTCANVGANTVTLTVTDVNGNSSTCTSTVTVMDTVRPVALCQNVTAYLNGSGSAIVGPGLIDAGSSDACGISLMVATPAIFSCASVGTNTVVLDVTDVNGNTSACTSTVTVLDTISPIANCQNITVQLNASGNATVTGAMINNSSTDACGIATLSASPSAFTCANVGPNTVTLTVTDVNGNSSACTSTVTVLDTVRPVALCQNITSHLNAGGTSTITGAMINNASTDACGIASLSASPSSFTCANVGANTVTLTVTDVNGNSSTCTSTVTVLDTVRPVANCQNITVQLNASGTATVTGAMVNNASTDACGIAALSASPGSFSCANVGANTVTLTVTDVNGNSSTCTSTVTVLDTVRPVANCQNINVQLSAAGTATVTGAMINGGSTDACGIASLSAAPSSFTCANVGANTVTLTVTDVNGNSSTCTSTVTVLDTVRPVALCQNINAYLSPAGSATVTGAMINAGSTDACGIASLSATPGSFSCANVGANTVTLTVTDVNGNNRTCTSVVTVLDTVRPVALCQNINAFLNPAGTVAINGSMLNAGSSDACGIATLASSVSSFSCANVGPNTVTLTVTDVNGNPMTCTSTVTVLDTIDPSAVCQVITIDLDSLGAATISESAINGGSTDACGIATFDTDITSFNCGDVGGNTLVLTVTDVNGNSSTCSVNVTVRDTVDPVAGCMDITLHLDATGNAGILPMAVESGSSDACGLDNPLVDISAFTCADLGPNTVTLTVRDVNGNFSTCTSTVTVLDTIDPMASCAPVTVYLDGAGVGTLAENALDAGSSDACSIMTFDTDINTFSCADTAGVLLTMTVTDSSGNASTCSAMAMVLDTLPPVAVCLDVTVQLDSAGIALITPGMVDGGSLDNCAINYSWMDSDTALCSMLGVNPVTLYLQDAAGNISSCVSMVNVVDTLGISIPALNLGPNVYDCAGDAILVATPGLDSYLWSDGSTNDSLVVTTPGIYHVTVTTVNGCANTDTVEVFDYLLADSLISTIGPSVVCSADTLLLRGPDGYVAYDWNTGATTRDITTSVGGWYSLFAADSLGCRHLDSIWVQQFAAPDPNPVISPNGNVVACDGEPVTLDAGSGYTHYWWNTGDTTQTIVGMAPSTYWVTVENAFGCRDSAAAVTVDLGAPVVASIAYVAPTLFASPTGVGFTYQWYFGGSILVGEVNSTHNPAASGDYSVVITNADGCEGSDTININIVGVNDGQLTGIEVFPNPSQGEVTIRPVGPIDYPVTVRVTDMLGQVVKEYTMAHLVDDEELDLTRVSAGVYQLELSCELGVYSVKLVVQ